MPSHYGKMKMKKMVSKPKSKPKSNPKPTTLKQAIEIIIPTDCAIKTGF